MVGKMKKQERHSSASGIHPTYKRVLAHQDRIALCVVEQMARVVVLQIKKNISEDPAGGRAATH